MSLRAVLNAGDTNRLPAVMQAIKIGDLLNKLLAGVETTAAAATVGGAIAETAATVATANAATQTGAYVQADVQTIATLANALKVAVNALVTDVGNAVARINQLRTDVLALAAEVASGVGVTEAAVTVTSNVATLANAPSALYAAVATTGTTTGMKRLLIGPISGPNALQPVTGQAVWDGGVKVLFAAADAVTAANFVYATAADATASLLQRELGETD